MMKILTLSLLLGCAGNTYDFEDTQEVASVRRYKAFDCMYLIDPATGNGDKRDALKVLRLDSTHYWYKWFNMMGQWGHEALNTFGEFSKFERLTLPLDKCPEEIKK